MAFGLADALDAGTDALKRAPTQLWCGAAATLVTGLLASSWVQAPVTGPLARRMQRTSDAWVGLYKDLATP